MSSSTGRLEAPSSGPRMSRSARSSLWWRTAYWRRRLLAASMP